MFISHGKKLVMIGGGGHCKSVLDAALRMNAFESIVITDPTIAKGETILGCEVVGTDDCLNDLRIKGFEYAFITVGSIGFNPLREKLANVAKTLGFSFPRIIDLTATISESAVIGEGTFVGKNTVVNADSKIGRHCIINTGAIIEHDCKIGDFSHISPGTTLCGQVKVGNDSHVGAGTVVKQLVEIGNRVLIGAGSTVLKDIPDNVKAYGNPCRVIE